MKRIRQHIASRQSEFARHPFFDRFEDPSSFHHAMAFAPTITFWVMAFQDILRLNEVAVRDPAMRKIARHHRVEDSGHDRWFLSDLARLGNGGVEVGTLFGKQHAPTRDAAYALVSEVFRATDDRLRIAFLLTLESSGHVFFERVAGFADRHGYGEALQYFSPSHLEVEKAHDMFEKKLDAELEAITLDDATYAEGIAMVDRAYAAFEALFDHLVRDTSIKESGIVEVNPGAAPQLRKVSA